MSFPEESPNSRGQGASSRLEARNLLRSNQRVLMSNTPEERSAEVKRIARKLAPHMAKRVSWNEAGYIECDFVRRDLGLDGVSTIFNPEKWESERLLYAIAVTLGQVLYLEIYGKMPILQRNPTTAEEVQQRDKDWRSGRHQRYCRRLDRMVLALLQNAGVPNAREKYCAYLGQVKPHSPDPKIAEIVRLRQAELSKPEG